MIKLTPYIESFVKSKDKYRAFGFGGNGFKVNDGDWDIKVEVDEKLKVLSIYGLESEIDICGLRDVLDVDTLSLYDIDWLVLDASYKISANCIMGNVELLGNGKIKGKDGMNIVELNEIFGRNFMIVGYGNVCREVTLEEEFGMYNADMHPFKKTPLFKLADDKGMLRYFKPSFAGGYFSLGTIDGLRITQTGFDKVNKDRGLTPVRWGWLELR